jgi:hypothetical protein
MVVRPEKSSNGEIVANTSFLVPHFEEGRARLLNMPFAEDINTITYEEQDDYYATLYTAEISYLQRLWWMKRFATSFNVG